MLHCQDCDGGTIEILVSPFFCDSRRTTRFRTSRAYRVSVGNNSDLDSTSVKCERSKRIYQFYLVKNLGICQWIKMVIKYKVEKNTEACYNNFLLSALNTEGRSKARIAKRTCSVTNGSCITENVNLLNKVCSGSNTFMLT